VGPAGIDDRRAEARGVAASSAKLSFRFGTPTIYSGMNSFRSLSRVRGALQVLIVGALVLLLTVALGMAVDAWIVAQARPLPEVQVIHIRHYVLPLGGLAVFAIILWRLVLPAAGDAVRTVLTGGPFGQFVRLTFCALIWFAIAVAVLEAAAHIQQHLYGFFLPN
jgi:hypothetical protein